MRKSTRVCLYLIVVFTAIAIAIPLLSLLIWCFANRWPWPKLLPDSWTFRGVERVFMNLKSIQTVFFSSVLLSFIAALLSTGVATLAARACVIYEFVGKKFIQFVATMPILVPVTIFGMAGHMLMMQLRINNANFAVVIIYIIYTLPYSMRIMMNSTIMIGKKFEEQAHVLMATEWQAFSRITLPLLLPSIVSAVGIAFLMSYSQYFLTMLIGGGKVQTVATLIFPLIQGGDRTISSVYSVMYIVSSLIIFSALQLFSNIVSKKSGNHLGV